MLVRLTPAFLATGLICPEGRRRIEYVDKGGVGMYIEVRATSPGKGTYYLRYKDTNGKTCHKRIGSTEEVELEVARARAMEIKAQLKLGRHPASAPQPECPSLTFTDFFEGHYLPYARPRKRTWQKDQELFNLRLKKAFGSLSLTEITRQQIQTFLAGLLAEGLRPSSANHYGKLIRRALNLAVDWGRLERSPATRLELFFENHDEVEHALDPGQLARLLDVLRTDNNRNVCRIFLFLLATGARLNEALKATWDMVDRENRVWRIPARNSKSKRVRAVPLNDAALEVLDDLDTEGRYEYLFINPRTQAPYSSVHKIWGRLRAKAGMQWLRIHDLRHTFASILVCNGRSLYEVQKILGHANPKVTQRYAHLSTKALQEASNSAAEAINGAMRKTG